MMKPTMQTRLYQVYVEDAEGKLLPVFPRAIKDVCELFIIAIRGQIAQGREKAWTNPHMVAVH